MDVFNRASLNQVLYKLPHIMQVIDDVKTDENTPEGFASLALAKIALHDLTTAIENALKG